MGNSYSLPILGNGLGTTPRITSLLIKPASAVCNLDCAYCFYLDRQADPYKELPARRMTTETLERLVDTYLFYSYPNSVFAFQGGEPTLAGLPFFEKLIEFQQQYGRDGQNVSNALQTNGILITWSTTGGQTNAVQTTTDLHAGFTNLGPNIVIPGTSAVTTNYLDTGAAVNFPALFYRVKVMP